ncbi:MAG: hypothetical protein R3E32_13670 [Chitinophagales bacterium]
MNYSISPANVAAFIAILFSIYNYRPNVQGDGYVNFGIFVLIIVSVGVLIADFLLQKFTHNYPMLVKVEGVILLLLVLIPTLSHRVKTFVLPENFTAEYVTTIYEVENAPPFCSKWTRSYKIEVPANGILVTSISLENDIANTNIQSHTGTDLNTNESMVRWLPFDGNTLECDGKIYRYQSWKIADPEKVYHRSEGEIKALKQHLTEHCEVILNKG